MLSLPATQLEEAICIIRSTRLIHKPGTLHSSPIASACEFYMCTYKNWLRRGDLNPRSFGYEPNDLTTCPPRDLNIKELKMVGGVGNAPTEPLSARFTVWTVSLTV